jgi:DNA (cytosine-5)-methyltransferase 1
MSLTIGSLFSGIGGLELGLERAGLGPIVWQCEIDPFCRAVLASHWPDAVRFEDVRQLQDVPRVDILCGGFPCQDVSDAGKRAGIREGTRSGLWIEFARIARLVRPRYVIVENVDGLRRNGLGRVLGDLSTLGFDAEWTTLRASDLGACHQRARIFIVAHHRSERMEGLSSESLRRFPELQRQQDERGASTFGGRSPLHVPELCRGSDGVPRWMDRLKSLGNAVVPQCAQVIGEMILRGAVVVSS